MSSVFHKLKSAVATVRDHRRIPLRLEFVLSDHCNLNCKGCTHYSPLVPDEHEPISQLVENMEHLGRVCGEDLQQVYLIGGEPLLYPLLEEAMEALRRNFPKSELYIFTNGIALPKMKESFWEICRRLDFIIAITRYPIRFDYDKVEKLCDSKGIRKEVFADRGESSSFFRFPLDPEKKQNGRLSHFKCFNRGCVSVIGNKIYPCSISGCVTHLNRAFGTDFHHEKGDRIDVRNVKGIADIRRLRDKPVPFCNYCILPPETIEYGASHREKSEWV